MYTQFYGLRERPFSITPDPRYLYMSQRHADGLAHLVYGVSQSGGFIQLTGEVGTGKTTLVRSLFEQLPHEADLAVILNPELTTQDFLIAICEELNLAVSPHCSTKTLVDQINRYLLEAHARGRRTVLIVDEAQNLGTDVLEQVRLLTNLETPKQKLLQIILIGQPELREILSREDMRQLAQRITGRYHLEPLSQEDTGKYIKHRMKIAGASDGIFLPAAIREIYRWSKGVPRLINVVTDRALLAGYSQDRRNIDKRLVRRAAAEVDGKYLIPRWRQRLATLLAVGGIALLALGVSLWLSSEFDVSLKLQPITKSETTDVVFNTEAAQVIAVQDFEIPETNLPGLENYLSNSLIPKDINTAFSALFDLWGAHYRPGENGPCEQAKAQKLHCWFQKGSINQIKRLNRPAILTLIGSDGEQHQIVVKSLEEETVDIAIGNQTLNVKLVDLSRYWYGDYLLLWRPGTLLGNDLIPGMEDVGVRWLKESLAIITGNNDTNSPPGFYGTSLEGYVRDYQREKRLTVDGIVGVQTQIVINTDLQIPNIPLLARVL